ncbi:hypothetical protein [Streptomyces sp. AS02]|uniref:hypothetical protein n=1 Tax=Streptomyces sp. AS02 TaxID=2938946 RepID=UPI002020626E|nr:hypothetical protein [Streptomyces sp. AS02]MCL8015888.1 hypothetical protein [Streptomyces sp. AS02]
MIVYDRLRRLESEPLMQDLSRGFAAELADPAWMLGRGWQMLEQQGANASSPVRVEYHASFVPVAAPAGDVAADPRITPVEAIVESEPGDHWTPGRRIAAGRRVAAAVALPDDPGLLLAGLPAPYDVLDGSGPDGRILWRRRTELDIDPALFPDPPPQPEPADRWNPAQFGYDADLPAGDIQLRLRRHDGGPLDWYSVDASGPIPAPAQLPSAVSVLTSRATYRGAPAPRWWQIENAKVDIGGYPPDRSHVSTTLLVDLVCGHSDDWYTFPVASRSGSVVTLHEVTVHDSFGENWRVVPPEDGWTLFAVDGLDVRSLAVWATATAPLQGPVLDTVLLGEDQDANLLWAVERRIGGREMPTTEGPAAAPPSEVDAQQPTAYAYRPTSDVPIGCHPYQLDDSRGRRRFVQARVADLTGPAPVLSPAPVSDLLTDPRAGAGDPAHQIDPSAVPPAGLRLERRAMLARGTDGRPVLWTQRSTAPLSAPPALRLRWDQMTPATTTS